MAPPRPRRNARVSTFVALVLLLLLALPPGTSAAPFSIVVSLRASGLSALTQVTNAGDGTNRLFLVERRGTIRVYQNRSLKGGFFLDIRSRVAAGGERGLLGLAFHPRFRTNRLLYVYFTRKDGDIVVARFRANRSRTAVIPSSFRQLMVIEHSAQANHNGGAMAFSPRNGYLYLGIGDGGGSGDPENDAQNIRRNLLGKVLRINVNGTGSGQFGRYSIPSSNPFAGSIPGRGEIWAYGLRNPWRLSFDRGTGKLFIADVGQAKWEEVNRELPSSKGGWNYGWRVMEGRHCFAATTCSLDGDKLPFAEYSHAGGNCSITGGHVYRGPTQAKLRGLYVFADFCSGRIWTVPHNGTNADVVLRADTAQRITSFGESERGELYAATIDGKLFLVRAP
jgi:glucose/arabinose dehydrogenase